MWVKCGSVTYTHTQKHTHAHTHTHIFLTGKTADANEDHRVFLGHTGELALKQSPVVKQLGATADELWKKVGMALQ